MDIGLEIAIATIMLEFCDRQIMNKVAYAEGLHWKDRWDSWNKRLRILEGKKCR